MKLVEKQHKVKYSEGIQTEEFGIIFNAKMAKILSDGLYSDKISAIIRELSTNGFDSQVEKGNKSTPLEVHLPTSFEPHFSIRDFGVGLTPEQIDKVYRFYGGSNKDDSNDFTGCLGLGSKTPFCYHTRTCDIESWVNGKHYVYSAHIGENGIPVLSKLAETDSDEPSGVKIKLPVHSSDIRNFADKAKDIYRYFEVVPKFIGNKIDVKKIEYSLKGDNWGLRKNVRTYSWSYTAGGYDTAECRAVMGNVAYTVTIQNLKDTRITEAHRNALNSAIDLFFDIGELDIEASREGLSYDNRTVRKIVDKVDKLVKEIADDAIEKISKEKNLWEARLKYIEVKDTITGGLSTVVDLSKITWKGKQLFPKNTWGRYSFSVDIPKSATYECSYFQNTYSNRRKTKEIDIGDVLFYENDMKVGAYVRGKHVADTERKTVYLLENLVGKERQEFLDMMGFDESYIKKISTITPPKNTTKRKGKGKTTAILKLLPDAYTSYKSYMWENTQKDLSDGGLYVEVNRFDVRNKDDEFVNPLKEIKPIIKNLQKVGITVPDIFGIKTAKLKKAKKDGSWECFFDWAEKKFTGYIKAGNIENALEAHKVLSSLTQYTDWYTFPKRINYHDLLALKPYVKNTNSKLESFLEKVEKYKNTTYDKEKIAAVDYLKGKFNVTLNVKTASLKDEENEIYEKYPLLGELHNVISSNPRKKEKRCMEEIAKYVKCTG